MSYALRKDGRGWRSVRGPEDCGDDEIFSVTTPDISAAVEAERAIEESKEKLRTLDSISIRDIRAFIAAQPGAPQNVKDHEAAAIAERVKLAQIANAPPAQITE